MASSLTSVGLVSNPSISSLKIQEKSYKFTSFANFGQKNHKTLKWVNPNLNLKRVILITASASNGSPGIYSSQQLELSVKTVDLVLEEVRPYLISDGGNVDVVSVEDGILTLQLQGACETCPSSTTTMTMGIERVLKEKFGDAVKDIRQVNEAQINETTVKAVNSHLDILRPAIKNYGGEVEVITIEDGDCTVKYKGPETIGSGIKAAIKERFPDISNVIFTS
ncbi:nifU-like protein 1, chloroplastic [Chenopodium quinoa]|uniref:NIF system FeS cluster assembly NifU C-terminal domain-containing protein n=1 Tax=Chenopodium quinoa TaxID=63459 RepID=A0A803M7D6_CHEQI|nr:nifU-like protein 1, chloroplastic [Chenopodium quinoa]XP_021768685.1 nifU-like protein 1, chloroplastic [Chenopodium quinoa]XP_021768686.1 nifU-like protein 1, chloroplastic [Chenopodium quinoa]